MRHHFILSVSASPVVAVVALAALAVACGGAPLEGVVGQHDAGADAAEVSTEVGDPGDDWGTHVAVQTAIVNECGGCHASSWQSCADARDGSFALQSAVDGGRMPAGGWKSSTDRATIAAWLAASTPCGR